MNTAWTRLAVLSIALFLTACASIQSSRAPNANLNVKDIKTAYVQKIEGDGYNVYQTITDRLNQLGIKATTGSAEFPPQRTDIIVTYVDRWMWDITMYMIRLTIQIRDGTSRAILSSAESYRPSLERRSQEEMVAETLDAAFNAK
jgi:hypothetical protein